MKYYLFKKLYLEALEYNDVDFYVAERGWQKWMDSVSNPGKTLQTIYTLANSTLKETRDELDISRAEFSRMYDIPLRSLENWDSGKTESPLYVKMLIDYSIYMSDQHD